MKPQKLSPLQHLDIPSTLSPKWQSAEYHRPTNIEEQEINKNIKRKLQNIYVKSSNDLQRDIDITKNNQFIEPTEKFKGSHFLLMDFSGLGSYKNQQRKGFMERKHRKRMMLPHLNCLYKKEAETQDKSLPKPKISDLMIDIQKNNAARQFYSSDRYQQNDKSVTPAPRKQGEIQHRIRTQPSSAKSFKLQYEDRYKRKARGPRVIQNQILKHSTNLNIIRKKMFSENRGRQPVQHRFNIQSSENQRFRSCNHIPADTNKEVELLTFYPKQPKQSEDEINQFLNDTKDDPPEQKEELYKFHFS